LVRAAPHLSPRGRRTAPRTLTGPLVPLPSTFVTLRVVLAEDNALLREGLSRLIAAEPDLELAGTCADLPGLLATVDEDPPDVVVTDIRMPPSGTDEGI